MLRNYKLLNKLNAIPPIFFGILSFVFLYFNGTKGESSVILGLRWALASLIVFFVISYLFYQMHYSYYRDKSVRKKLYLSLAIIVFGILVITMDLVDSKVVFLADKKILSFTSVIIFNGITILYLMTIFNN